jgi:hypothetical protein
MKNYIEQDNLQPIFEQSKDYLLLKKKVLSIARKQSKPQPLRWKWLVMIPTVSVLCGFLYLTYNLKPQKPNQPYFQVGSLFSATDIYAKEQQRWVDSSTDGMMLQQDMVISSNMQEYANFRTNLQEKFLTFLKQKNYDTTNYTFKPSTLAPTKSIINQSNLYLKDGTYLAQGSVDSKSYKNLVIKEAQDLYSEYQSGVVSKERIGKSWKEQLFCNTQYISQSIEANSDKFDLLHNIIIGNTEAINALRSTEGTRSISELIAKVVTKLPNAQTITTSSGTKVSVSVQNDSLLNLISPVYSDFTVPDSVIKEFESTSKRELVLQYDTTDKFISAKEQFVAGDDRFTVYSTELNRDNFIPVQTELFNPVSQALTLTSLLDYRPSGCYIGDKVASKDLTDEYNWINFQNFTKPEVQKNAISRLKQLVENKKITQQEMILLLEQFEISYK